MKIWISKNSEVPVRDQLIAQITLGIAASDFKSGDKLPSTREIARRYDLHPNTVSSAYQELVERNLLRFRKGSGFYIAESAAEQVEGARRLDDLIKKLLEEAQALGFDDSEVLKRLRKPRATVPATRIVLVESDPGLRDILMYELAGSFQTVESVTFEDFCTGVASSRSIFTAMFDEKPKIEPLLKDGQRCVYLKGRSVAMTMSGEARPAESETVAVLSGWDGFLNFARILLLAAKLDPGRLIVRSTADDGWSSSASSASMIICDLLTASQLNGRSGVRSFRIIADESIAELQSLMPQPSLS